MTMRQALLVLIVISLLAGCSRGPSPPSGSAQAAYSGEAGAIEKVESSQPREASPHVGKADQAALVAGNTDFAFSLYQVLRPQDGNLFFSPYSLSMALAMTYAGARGETERQMAKALHFKPPQVNLHPAFDALDLTLAQRGRGAAGTRGEPFRLTVANALWGQQGYHFLPTYLDLLARNYGAGMRLVNFGDPEPARRAINDWVANQTELKIQNLVPPGVIRPGQTMLILTNAIYFDAAWLHRFNPRMNCPGEFTLLDGKKVGVEMMRQTEEFGYTEGDGYQAVELPYSDQELSMVILLPRPGRFESFDTTLSADRVKKILKGLPPFATTRVALTMPKFEYESPFTLNKTLAALGMYDAFTGAADFSGMDGKHFLYITDVLHKALVRVNEEGTQAAAATAIAMAGGAAAPSRIVEFTVDRPFIFLIRDRATGAVLFVGRVLNPKT
jgi:serpin B